jgi:NitT/TauT family transport system permease protein
VSAETLPVARAPLGGRTLRSVQAARRPLLRLGGVVAFLAAWELAVRVLGVPAYILPTPTSIAVALYRGIASSLYIDHIWITLVETLLGFLLGSAIALVLGTLVALSRPVEYFLYPFILMFQSMPKVALAPLIIVWFGLGLTSKVVQAAFTAFFPLMVNTIVGLRSADEDRVALMRSLDASELQIFAMLRVPSAMPFIMAGFEIAMVLSLIGAIVAEFVGAQKGLGMLITSMTFTMDVAGQFSVLLVLSLMGLALNSIIVFARKRVLFWDPSQKTTAQSPAKGGTV